MGRDGPQAGIVKSGNQGEATVFFMPNVPKENTVAPEASVPLGPSLTGGMGCVWTQKVPAVMGRALPDPRYGVRGLSWPGRQVGGRVVF